MTDPGEFDVHGPDGRAFVLVPRVAGRVIAIDTPGSPRARDDLDELIDELFPDIDYRPGWFDAALVALGAGLLAWAFLGSAPTIVIVVGLAMVTLGCVLPARNAWRRTRAARRRKRLEGQLEQGVLIDVSRPTTARLVGGYEELVERTGGLAPDLGEPAIAAAHAALLEVATLLGGRAPETARELDYVDARANAVAALVAALGELPAPTASLPGDGPAALDTEAVIEAREELDRIAPLNSVTRLQALTAEAEVQRRGRS